MTKVYDNSGALFKNDRKEREGQPDYNGNLIIEGKEYWISGWRKDGRKGQFIGLSFKPKDADNRPNSGKTWGGDKPRYSETKRQQDDEFDSPF